jgi:leucyl aminopeptidase
MTLSLVVAAPDFGALDTPLLVVALASSPTLGGDLNAVDAATGGALGRALTRRDFRGGRDETLHLAGGGAERGVQRVLLVGMGTTTDRASALRRAGAIAGRAANKAGVGRLAFYAGALSAVEVEAAGLGLIAGSWDFKEFKSPTPPEEDRASLAEATILAADQTGARHRRSSGARRSAKDIRWLGGSACCLATSAPPTTSPDTARDIAKRLGMEITVLGREAMALAKMGSFLSVAQGTTQDPKLIALKYSGGATGAAPVVLVGKGLCFDSGGISIKPAQGMEWMKFDMCGAAGVLGAMEAIGRMELPINVVGLIGSTTNMPSGEAVKPGDVVQASNGKFIEIINTDAEGRLVLADVPRLRQTILAGRGDRRRNVDRSMRDRPRTYGDRRARKRRSVGAGSA